MENNKEDILKLAIELLVSRNKGFILSWLVDFLLERNMQRTGKGNPIMP
jgi:hypothetical protein